MRVDRTGPAEVKQRVWLSGRRATWSLILPIAPVRQRIPPAPTHPFHLHTSGTPEDYNAGGPNRARGSGAASLAVRTPSNQVVDPTDIFG